MVSYRPNNNYVIINFCYGQCDIIHPVVVELYVLNNAQ